MAFCTTSGVVNVGALMPSRSWVDDSSSSSFGPATPSTFTPMLMIALSRRSGGAVGPGPAKRTKAR